MGDRGKKQIFSLSYLWRNPLRITVEQARKEIRAGRSFYVIVELEQQILYWRPGESYLYETGRGDKEAFAIAKNIWRPPRND